MEKQQLPGVHLVKPKLEHCKDSPAAAKGGETTTPLSGDHPFFTVVMSRTQVEKPYQLGIPTHFHRRLPAKRATVVLQCGGRSWLMGYCGDTKVKRLDVAWEGFAVDNRLRVGDACVFELVAPRGGGAAGEVVFQVQVLRGDLPDPGEMAASFRGATADEPIVIEDD